MVLYFMEKTFKATTEFNSLKYISTNHQNVRQRVIPTTEKMSSGWPVEYNVETTCSCSNSSVCDLILN